MELFSFLDPLRRAGFTADFVPRITEVSGSYDKDEALAELEPYHRQAIAKLDRDWSQLWRAEQVHGIELATITDQSQGGSQVIAGVDGLMCAQPGIVLGIYVADCGLIWLADRETGSIALLHSGRKGTEGGILPKAVAQMGKEFGTRPRDLLAVLGPCIRPPHYEVDIARQLAEQACDCGVGEFQDSGICTGVDLATHYSYRLEKGRTGRMLGLFESFPHQTP